VLGVGSDSRAREVVAWRVQQRMVSQAEGQQGVIEEQRQVDREAYEEYRTKKRESGLYKPRYGQVDFKTRLKERKEKSSTPVVAVVVKGDVDGSVEAILSCLETYSSEDVLLDIVHFGVGPVSETDVTMAESFGAVVYAFNTTVPGPVMKVAEAANVPVKSFDVIYHLIGDLKLEIGDRLPPLEVEDTVGRGTVMQQFLVTEKKRKVTIAGCRVVAGRFPKEGFYRLARAGQMVHEGRLASLKHMKEEVSEIGQNKECGLRFADAEEVTFESGDSIVCFTTRMEARACDWNPGF
jgi:translation initiation factor IF-2